MSRYDVENSSNGDATEKSQNRYKNHSVKRSPKGKEPVARKKDGPNGVPVSIMDSLKELAEDFKNIKVFSMDDMFQEKLRLMAICSKYAESAHRARFAFWKGVAAGVVCGAVVSVVLCRLI